MNKNFVLDTNVLLTDPYAFKRFDEHTVIIPITVLEELDKFKRDLNTVGRNAREVARAMDVFRGRGNLSKGVRMENGGLLRVETDLGKEPPLPFPTLGKTADSLILAAALKIKKREDCPCVFVTRDVNLRLRADAVGLTAENYEEGDAVTVEEMYSGSLDIEMTPRAIDRFLTAGYARVKDVELLSNQCVRLIDKTDTERVVLGRYDADGSKIVPLFYEGEDMWGISARNTEQDFAIDLLLDDSIQVVTLVGKAGTGKTLLAIAAGMRKVADENAYSKLVVARPVMPLGRELGFLPGEIGEKLRPWMEPVFDNLEIIMNSRARKMAARQDLSRGKKIGKHKKQTFTDLQQLMDTGILEVQALTYIRGRSLPRQFLVIDEAQNLTHHEVKTIVTRAGEGAKVVLTGDTYQIDNPFLDSTTSGLTVVVERFKGEEIAGHVTLAKGERSALAELASNLL